MKTEDSLLEILYDLKTGEIGRLVSFVYSNPSSENYDLFNSLFRGDLLEDIGGIFDTYWKETEISKQYLDILCKMSDNQMYTHVQKVCLLNPSEHKTKDGVLHIFHLITKRISRVSISFDVYKLMNESTDWNMGRLVRGGTFIFCNSTTTQEIMNYIAQDIVPINGVHVLNTTQKVITKQAFEVMYQLIDKYSVRFIPSYSGIAIKEFGISKETFENNLKGVYSLLSLQEKLGIENPDYFTKGMSESEYIDLMFQKFKNAWRD